MEEEIACRICFSGEEDGPLVQPCACRGSASWVHPQCLEHWRRTSMKADAAYRCGQCQDKYRDALSIELLRDRLQTCRRQFGEAHRTTVHYKNTLALQLHEQGKYEQAAALQRECLEFMRATRGNADETTLNAITNYAGALYDFASQRGHARAELFPQIAALYREAMEGFKALLGERDEKTLDGMRRLAMCLLDMGDVAGAVSMFRQVLAVSRDLLGDRDRLTLSVKCDLGSALKRLGDLEGASVMMRECLEGQRQTIGSRHPGTLDTMSNLGLVMLDQGDVAGALELKREVLQARREIQGDDHPDTESEIALVAHIHKLQGNWAEALELFREFGRLRGAGHEGRAWAGIIRELEARVAEGAAPPRNAPRRGKK